MTFTGRVRDELAHAPVRQPRQRLVEVTVALRVGGALHLRGGTSGRLGVVVTTDSHAVARRLHASIRALTDERPLIEVHDADGIRRQRRVVLRLDTATTTLQALGVLDGSGRPSVRLPPGLVRTQSDAAAALAGALMVAGSVSDPLRHPHLELRAPGRGAADDLRAICATCGVVAATGQHGGTWRVVVKSAEGVARVLARAGAHSAFLEWDQARLRRELRAEANRAANADRANLGRTVAASTRQVAAIHAVVGRLGWDALDDDLRALALARLANPEVTLAELGALLEPPVGKAAVHRRIRRLEALAAADADAL